MVWRLKANGGSGAPNGALDPTFNGTGFVELSSGPNQPRDRRRDPARRQDRRRGEHAHVPEARIRWRFGGCSKTARPTRRSTPMASRKSATRTKTGPTRSRCSPTGRSWSRGPPQNATIGQRRGRVAAEGERRSGRAQRRARPDVRRRRSGRPGQRRATRSPRPSPSSPTARSCVAGDTSGGPLGNDALVWRLEPNGGESNIDERRPRPHVRHRRRRRDRRPGRIRRGPKRCSCNRTARSSLAGTSKAGASPFAADVWRLLANGGSGAVNGALDPTFGAGGTHRRHAGLGRRRERARAAARPQDRRRGLHVRRATCSCSERSATPSR